MVKGKKGKCGKPKGKCKCGCKKKDAIANRTRSKTRQYKSDTVQKRQPPEKNPIILF